MAPVEMQLAPQQCEGESLSFTDSARETSPTPLVSSREMVLNLVTGGLGTGMLSLPWAMAGASIVVGVGTILAVTAVNLWTIAILVEAAEKYQAFDLAAVLGHLPGRLGKGMQIFTNSMVWVALFGSLISYIIGMCDCAQPFIQGTFLEQRLVIAGVSTLIVLPLCFLDQKYLSFSSGAAVLVNMYLMAVVFSVFASKAVDGKLPGSCTFGVTTGSVTMMSTMMQCVIIQMCVLPMYKELEDRSPKKFSRLILVAFLVLALLFAAISTAGYLAFGSSVDNDLLKQLPHSVPGNAARVGMFLVLAAVYPIMMIAMIAPIKNMEVHSFGSEPGASWRKQTTVTSATLGLIVASYLVAWKVEDLGLVNVVDGAICVGVFTSLAPGLVGLFLLDKPRIAMYTLLAVGLGMSCAGLVFTDNKYEDLWTGCILPKNTTQSHVLLVE